RLTRLRGGEPGAATPYIGASHDQYDTSPAHCQPEGQIGETNPFSKVHAQVRAPAGRLFEHPGNAPRRRSIDQVPAASPPRPRRCLRGYARIRERATHWGEP